MSAPHVFYLSVVSVMALFYGVFLLRKSSNHTPFVGHGPVSYTHLTLPTILRV